MVVLRSCDVRIEYAQGPSSCSMRMPLQLLILLAHAVLAARNATLPCWKKCVLCRFPTDIPYQTNGSDCGVFALQYAEHVSRDAALDFDQQDMPILRLKTAADIVSLTIL